MKRLIVVRHGDYQGDMTISDLGVRQMRKLARQLRRHVEGNVVRVLTSTAPRATGSARVLVEELSLSGYIEALVLWKDNEHWSDVEEALGFVREQFQGVDVLIVVTHLDHAEELPGLFAKKVLGRPNFDQVGLKKGQAVIVDSETIEVIVIRPEK